MLFSFVAVEDIQFCCCNGRRRKKRSEGNKAGGEGQTRAQGFVSEVNENSRGFQ